MADTGYYFMVVQAGSGSDDKSPKLLLFFNCVAAPFANSIKYNVQCRTRGHWLAKAQVCFKPNSSQNILVCYG